MSDVLRELAPHIDAAAEAALIHAGEETDPACPGGWAVLPGCGRSCGARRGRSVTSAHRSLALSRLAAVSLPAPYVLVCGDLDRARQARSKG